MVNFNLKINSKDHGYNSRVKVVYEDRHIIIIYKPPGMLSQKSKAWDYSVNEFVKDYYKSNNIENDYAGLIHRLDRPVGGPVMVAKSKRAAELFSRALRNRKIRKKYTAVVYGILSEKNNRLQHLIRNKDGKVACIGYGEENKEYKLSELEYSVISESKINNIQEFDNCFSLLSVNLITGRKHQIRAQLSAIGHPIVGDDKYYNIEGAGRESFSMTLISKMHDANFVNEGEIALYCHYLSFKHPLDNGNLVEISIPYPDNWIIF